MVIRIICVGRTVEKELQSLIETYGKRLSNYARVKWNVVELPSSFSSQPADKVKNEEWLRISKLVPAASILVLLDEKGKEFTSTEFAAQIQKYQNTGKKELVFVIGGAYGFAEEAYKKADAKIALSKMTLTHQMVRLLFVEQLYRAHTILKGEKYHH